MQETQEMWVRSLGREDPLEESTATHSSILAGRIPWTEEPGGLRSIVSQSQTWLSELAHTHVCKQYEHMYAQQYECIWCHWILYLMTQKWSVLLCIFHENNNIHFYIFKHCLSQSINFFSQNNIASMTILASFKTKPELSVELFLLSKVANYSIKRMLIQIYFNAWE